jgi:hypothetical protein
MTAQASLHICGVWYCSETRSIATSLRSLEIDAVLIRLVRGAEKILLCQWIWRQSLSESGACGLHRLPARFEKVVATSGLNGAVRNHPSGDKLKHTTPSGASIL